MLVRCVAARALEKAPNCKVKNENSSNNAGDPFDVRLFTALCRIHG